MIVRNPEARIKYLEEEIKVRERRINRALRPGVDYLSDEEIIDLRNEVLIICDEIEELEEAAEKGKEIIK